MGAEPGRRSLKMPAEKLGPVIVDKMPSVNFTSCLFQHKKKPKIKVLLWTSPASRQGRSTDATLLLQQMKNIFEWEFLFHFWTASLQISSRDLLPTNPLLVDCLIPADPTVGRTTKQIQSIKVLGEFYKEDLTKPLEELVPELRLWYRKLSRLNASERPTDVLGCIKSCCFDAFPNIFTLLHIF